MFRSRRVIEGAHPAEKTVLFSHESTKKSATLQNVIIYCTSNVLYYFLGCYVRMKRPVLGRGSARGTTSYHPSLVRVARFHRQLRLGEQRLARLAEPSGYSQFHLVGG